MQGTISPLARTEVLMEEEIANAIKRISNFIAVFSVGAKSKIKKHQIYAILGKYDVNTFSVSKARSPR